MAWEEKERGPPWARSPNPDGSPRLTSREERLGHERMPSEGNTLGVAQLDEHDDEQRSIQQIDDGPRHSTGEEGPPNARPPSIQEPTRRPRAGWPDRRRRESPGRTPEGIRSRETHARRSRNHPDQLA
jgi:hypothetical protein